MEDTKRKVISLAISLALQESAETGEDYSTCTSKALDEACIRLGINSKEFIKMFM